MKDLFQRDRTHDFEKSERVGIHHHLISIEEKKTLSMCYSLTYDLNKLVKIIGPIFYDKQPQLSK